MSQYSIKQFSQITGLNKVLIRTWENRYDFLKPERTSTNIRLYNDEMLVKGIKYAVLVKNGYKISKIVKYSDEYINTLIEEIINLENNNKEDIYILRLIDSAISIDQNKFEETYNLCVNKLGFIKFYKDILIKTMRRISVLYLNNNITPANEHFLSENIRIKISCEIEKIKNNNPQNTWILFLPENEYHDIGLLFSYLILKKNNQKVVYLGQNIPRESLLRFKSPNKNINLLTFLNTNKKREFYNEFPNFLNKNFNDSHIHIVQREKKADHDNIKYLSNINDLINIIDKKK